MGFKLDGKYYVDKSMPMSCSVSCSTWVQFSTFLEWFVKLEGGTGATMHYLDDFLFVGHWGSNECDDLLKEFHKMCDFIGVPIAHEKTEGPVTKLIFLGLEIDSIAETLKIPQAKLEELREKIFKALSRKKLSLKEMQSIIGSLNFACRAIAPGRAFIRRFPIEVQSNNITFLELFPIIVAL